MAVVLLWSFGGFTLFNYLLVKYVEGNDFAFEAYLNGSCISVGAMLCPLFGWLADTYIGRYRVIKSSLIVMWVGAILLTVVKVVTVFYGQDRGVIFLEEACVTVVLCLALGTFEVNILQFSIDQLLDASSEEIISFIVWCVWTFFSSKVVVQLLACSNSIEYVHQLLSCLYVAVVLTLSVSSDALCNHWLTKEPVTPNPLKLIFKVLRYAATNKYPRNRSVFFRNHSRINLAKTQYGGPFTSKEVEDVKTFFRILKVTVVGSSIFTVSLLSGYEALSKFQGPHGLLCAVTRQASECLKAVSVSHAGYQLMVLCVPLFEFVLRPFFRKWFLKLCVRTQFCIGGVLLILHLFGLISLEVVGSVGSISVLGNRGNFTCKDYLSGAFPPSDWCDSGTEDFYYWLIVPSCVHVVGQCLILTAGLEFVYAQAPSSMKGTVVGFTYCFGGLSFLLLQLIFLPFSHTVISVSGVELGCVFWFLVTCTVCTVILGLVLGVTSRSYKNRERGEDTAVDPDADPGGMSI